MQKKLYQIKDSTYFRTGRLPDGNQVLVAPFGKEVISIHFSREGRYLRLEAYPNEIGTTVVSDPEEVDRLISSLGVELGTIHVEAFAIPGRGFAIREMPDYLQDYVDSPSSFPPERAPYLAKAVSDWKKRQDFVLIWGEDYEMSKEGDVEST